MIEFLKKWCEELIVSAIVSILVEMLVPEGNIKKYVRVIIGIYIVFVIINPVVRNIGSINLETWSSEVQKNSNTIANSQIEEMSNIYARTMENEIKSKFDFISEVRISLTEDLEDVERIEIEVLSENDIVDGENKLDELKSFLNENYGITEDKIYIL